MTVHQVSGTVAATASTNPEPPPADKPEHAPTGGN